MPRIVALVAAGCSSGKQAYTIRPEFFWDSLFRPDSAIINGLGLTIGISVIAQFIGVILGVFAAMGRMAKFLPFRIVANFYIWVFRGTPLLVQLSFFYYGLATAGLFKWPTVVAGPIDILPEILAGIVILGVNEGAYMAEIVRAGILAVDPGQTEAAKSLGMTYGQTMSRIVLPQAARVIIPPLGNEFNNMLKTTSLLSALSIFELYNTFSVAAGQFVRNVRVVRRVRGLVPAADDHLGRRPEPDREDDSPEARPPTRPPARVPETRASRPGSCR